MTDDRYGVGIIGAGPGVSALHVPTLARVGDRFRIVHVSDSGSGRSAAIAERYGARSSTGIDLLLADDAVDVVAICSPPEDHAAQILAAVEAGTRAILCEKPIGLTSEDVDAVIDACRRAGVTLIVGTNHVYDPAWSRAKHHLLLHGGQIESITVSIALPPNDRYHAAVTQTGSPSTQSSRPAPDWSDPDIAARLVRSLILGLAIHDLPLVRDLAPEFRRIVFARPVAPIGYAIGFLAGDVTVALNAAMLPSGADADWTMRILTANDEIEVAFPPAFVHAGSAAVHVRERSGRTTSYRQDTDDGYVAEWLSLAAAISGTHPPEYEEIRADARFAIELADAAAAWIRMDGVR